MSGILFSNTSRRISGLSGVEFLGAGDFSSFNDISAISDLIAEADLLSNPSVADLSCSIVTARASWLLEIVL